MEFDRTYYLKSKNNLMVKVITGIRRVGRLIGFKEILRYNLVPFTIDKVLKAFYYRGFKIKY